MGAKKLSQLIKDAKNQGWYDWIVEPDGQVHPNNERALLEGCYFDKDAAQKIQDFCVQFLTLPREQGEMIADYELDSIKRRFPSFDPDTPATMKPFAMLRWWHRRVIGQLYGWRTPTGARRFKRGFVTTAKKCLAVGTEVPTTTGFKKLQDIQAGEFVYSPDGNKTKVTATHGPFQDLVCYRITFDNGESLVACEDHLWETANVYEQSVGKLRTRTTAELFHGFQKKNGAGPPRSDYCIYNPRPVENDEKELPIHPYALGVWLGDGTSKSSEITLNKSDFEIVENLRSFGILCEEQRNKYPGQMTILLDRERSSRVSDLPRTGRPSMYTRLRKMNLLKNKHIPAEYFLASVQQRWWLLQGLMDTDGCCTNRGGNIFAASNEILARQVFSLIASLGMKPNINAAKSKCNGKFFHYWRVEFKAFSDQPVFRLSRKQSRLTCRTERNNRSGKRKVVNIEPIPSEPVCCITVDHPSSMFLVGKGYIPTHNSGKTTTLAALPLAELLIGGVPEKEIYVVAVTEEQAGYLFKKSLAMANRSNEIKPLLKFNASTNRIINERTASVFRTLAAMEGPIHGIQPNLLIMDELHAWYGREIYDALIYGDIRRVDSLRLIITTAGKDESCVAYEELESARELLDPNDSRYEQDAFAFIAEAGRDPITGQMIPWEWDDLESVIQANPSLSENPQPLSKIKQELESVKKTPGKKGAWIQLMCNRYTSVSEAWISQDWWRACKADIPSHDGEPVWLGLDLASVEDLVALAMVWHSREKGKIDLRVRFWMPDAEIDDKAHRWQVPQLREWIAQGWIETCPGRVIRNDFLRAAISGVVLNEFGGVTKLKDGNSVAERFSIEELAYDRAGAQELVIQQLGDRDGLPVVEHSQGFLGMSVPSKEFSRRIACREIQHDGNPVLDWMIKHCVVDIDPAGNIKPTKKKSRQKIDGIVASIMAVGRCTLTVPKKNVYERRGVLVF